MTGRPTAGARFVLERTDVPPGSEAVLYRGFVHLPDADLPLEARVELPGGAVHTSIGSGSGREGSAADKDALERTARALVRSAIKAPLSSGLPLPRKIVRWRA